MNPHAVDLAAALRAAGFESISNRGWCRRIERYFLPLTDQEQAVNEQGGLLWPGQTQEVYAEFCADLAGWLKLAEESAGTDRPDLRRWRRWLDTYAGGSSNPREVVKYARSQGRRGGRKPKLAVSAQPPKR